MNQLEQTFTLHEVANYFNVADKTVRRWIKLRRINARRVGLRKYFFTRSDMEAAERGTK